MIVLRKEWKQGWKGLAIWTVSIGAMLAICIAMFPEMKNQMAGVTKLFASMGSFTKAFGMDMLNFGELIGFYGVECGNILGIGGGFFAAFLGITMLSKEEREHTAEFLLTHPVTRGSVLRQKLLAVMIQILVMNLVVFLISCGTIVLIGEPLPWKELLLLHGVYLFLQLELGGICFGISAYLYRGSIGIGIGLAALLYFLNLICNISDQAEFLKYITPFAYAEPSAVLTENSVDGMLIALGCIYTASGICAGFVKYIRKDVR